MKASADYVAKEREKIFYRLQESHALGMVAKGAFRQLKSTFWECSTEGWDGERAKPITKEVLRDAEIFLESFPLGVEAPDIGAEPDGAISLEWYRSPDRVVSVSVNPGGWLYYAAIIGSKQRRGKNPVLYGVSGDLLALIVEVTGEKAV